jgi:hypothetical protein
MKYIIIYYPVNTAAVYIVETTRKSCKRRSGSEMSYVCMYVKLFEINRFTPASCQY